MLKRESLFFRYQEKAIKRRISAEKRLKAHVTIFNLSAVVIIFLYEL